MNASPTRGGGYVGDRRVAFGAEAATKLRNGRGLFSPTTQQALCSVKGADRGKSQVAYGSHGTTRSCFHAEFVVHIITPKQEREVLDPPPHERKRNNESQESRKKVFS